MSVVGGVKTILTCQGIAFEPCAVQGGGFAIAFSRIVVAAGLHPDVGGHVHQVTATGDQRAQSVGGGLGDFRPWGRFHGVDVQMVGRWMIRVPPHGAF